MNVWGLVLDMAFFLLESVVELALELELVEYVAELELELELKLVVSEPVGQELVAFELEQVAFEAQDVLLVELV